MAFEGTKQGFRDFLAAKQAGAHPLAQHLNFKSALKEARIAMAAKQLDQERQFAHEKELQASQIQGQKEINATKPASTHLEIMKEANQQVSDSYGGATGISNMMFLPGKFDQETFREDYFKQITERAILLGADPTKVEQELATVAEVLKGEPPETFFEKVTELLGKAADLTTGGAFSALKSLRNPPQSEQIQEFENEDTGERIRLINGVYYIKKNGKWVPYNSK